MAFVSTYCSSYIIRDTTSVSKKRLSGFFGMGYETLSTVRHCISMGLCLWGHDSPERRRSVLEVGWAVSGYMVEKIMAEGLFIFMNSTFGRKIWLMLLFSMVLQRTGEDRMP